MTQDQHKAFVRSLFEAVNARDVDTIEQAYSRNFINHAVPPGVPSGREGIKSTFTALFTAFPDYHVTVEDLLADGDRVAARVSVSGTHRGDFFGIPPTGRQVRWSAIDLFRIADRQVAEYWLAADMLGLLQQLRTPSQQAA